MISGNPKKCVVDSAMLTVQKLRKMHKNKTKRANNDIKQSPLLRLNN